MFWIEIIKVIILGIVEGVTEWLPISSTGHMILVDEFIKLNVTQEFKNLFFVVIQLGAILAVLVLYFKKLFPIERDTITKKFKFDKDTLILWLKIIVATIPIGIVGVLFEDTIDKLLNSYVVVAITLIVYGILFIIIENRNKNKQAKVKSLKELTYKTALCIGLFQCLSIIPGTSRSGATILGAILIGTSRGVAAEFTFFLAIPAMAGASLLKLLKYGGIITSSQLILLIVGMVVAFVISIFAIKFLVGYVKKKDFKVFGWYRIVLGILVLAYFLLFN